MKTNNKNKKVKLFTLGVILVSMVSFGTIMQSCNNEDEIDVEKNYPIYLDIKMSVDKTLSSAELSILSEAYKRI
jgi:hypothetical protein